nr:hypothetical protein [Longimicrobium sp.]
MKASPCESRLSGEVMPPPASRSCPTTARNADTWPGLSSRYWRK